MRRIADVAFVIAFAGVMTVGFQSWAMDMLPTPRLLKWAEAPPVLAKGAEMAVLSGDPTKDGPYVFRLKLPANYAIPAHHHPTTENVTVLSGTLYAGMGTSWTKQRLPHSSRVALSRCRRT